MGYNDKALELEQQGVAQEVLLKTQQQAAADADLERRIKQENLTSSQVTRIKQGQQQAEQVSQRSSYVEMITNSDMPEVKKKAITVAINAGAYDGKADKLYEIAYPDKNINRDVRVVGKNLYDVSSGTWITSPNAAGLSPSEFLSTIDPDEYDPSSIGDFSTAIRTASTAEAQDAAYDLLRPKAETGSMWTTGYNEDNEEIKVQRPIEGTSNYRNILQEVNANNNAGERAIRVSENALEVADKLIDALANNKVETGITGAVLRYFPETGEADFQAGIDTILANLGINELADIRAASVNGASGFGQLTQRELDRLEARLRSLSMKQSRGALEQNLMAIRTEFEMIKNRSKTNWTFDESIGVARRPSETDVITTQSGNTYQVQKR
jgi:hypothetical protein